MKKQAEVGAKDKKKILEIIYKDNIERSMKSASFIASLIESSEYKIKPYLNELILTGIIKTRKHKRSILYLPPTKSKKRDDLYNKIINDLEPGIKKENFLIEHNLTYETLKLLLIFSNINGKAITDFTLHNAGYASTILQTEEKKARNILQQLEGNDLIYSYKSEKTKYYFTSQKGADVVTDSFKHFLEIFEKYTAAIQKNYDEIQLRKATEERYAKMLIETSKQKHEQENTTALAIPQNTNYTKYLQCDGEQFSETQIATTTPVIGKIIRPEKQTMSDELNNISRAKRAEDLSKFDNFWRWFLKEYYQKIANNDEEYVALWESRLEFVTLQDEMALSVMFSDFAFCDETYWGARADATLKKIKTERDLFTIKAYKELTKERLLNYCKQIKTEYLKN